MSDAPSPLTLFERGVRVLRIAGESVYRGAIEFSESENLTFSASIAYYSLLSFFPFVVLMGAIFAQIGGPGQLDALADLIEHAVPSKFEFLSKAVRELKQTPVPFSVAGIVVTAWAAMGHAETWP